MKPRSSRVQYVALALYIVISFGYYVAGVIALRESWFYAEKYARVPVDVNDYRQTIVGVEKEAKSAGLSKGDTIKALNGKSFTGDYQLFADVRRSRPGDTLAITVRQSNGPEITANVRLASREGPPWDASIIALLITILFVPLLSLVIGYWVVTARPYDPNAWLVLVLLSFSEAFFGNLNPRWWPGILFVLLSTWSLILQFFCIPALLLFGFYFPERWRVDKRWPWLKWLILIPQFISFFLGLWLMYIQLFHASWGPPVISLDFWTDIIVKVLQPASIILFLTATFDKLRSASTADARRRLRVLAVGSAISLGPLLFVFAALPYFGFNPSKGSAYEIVVPFFVIFPLTLAYVVVVQRAMDVRLIIRQSLQYTLARRGVVFLQILLSAVLFSVVTALVASHAMSYVETAVLIGAGLWGIFLLRGMTHRLAVLIDRRFFREAYNTEVILSQLSEETRKYTEKQPLIEMVSKRISEVLHVPQMAVWVRGSNHFHPQQVIGASFSEPALLSENSSTVQALVRSRQPVPLYRDNPDEWFIEADTNEKRTLNQLQTELLLGLPGSKQLMGVIALGSKRSEEPYTPSDLRLLQTVAVQTGLALEVSDLAESLAKEAAQRARINREIEIAREVQERLFPQRMPIIPGVTLAGACRPAQGVGGDYYDVIQLGDGRLGLAIGDVSGKGISAALLMASLRACLRTMTVVTSMDLARLMEKMNQLVYESSAVNRYATFFFAVYDPSSRALRYVNAGHNPPALLRSSTDDPVMRLEAGGPVVGLLPVVQYEEQSVTLQIGDLLLAYTDGISEAMTEDDEEWGEERMLQTVKAAQSHSVKQILQETFQAADQFTAGAMQHDDMTLLFMKIE